ncbi:unnamed protein product, partial [Amoebophrya sp. A25]|eukprot:GSA25T00015117001.1
MMVESICHGHECALDDSLPPSSARPRSLDGLQSDSLWASLITTVYQLLGNRSPHDRRLAGYPLAASAISSSVPAGNS